MSFTLGFILFAVGIGFSVAVHEFGHLLTAKAFGMKATEYFVGFGPKIWSFRKGETEYGLKAIPAGGYVKISGFTHTEQVDPVDEPRAFWRYAAWKRLIVLAAGSVTHFIIAFVVLFIAALSVGLPTDRPVIGQIDGCVAASSDGQSVPGCDDAGAIPGAAQAAGLQDGDRIVEVGGTAVPTYESLVRKVRSLPDQTVELAYIRDGERRTTSISIPAVQRPPLDDPDSKDYETVGAIGIRGSATETYGAGAGLGEASDLMGQAVVGTFKGIARLPSKVPEVIRSLGGEQRDADGPVSVVGVSRFGGQAVEAESWLTFLLLLASFNVFIGIFNLFPFLPLDGGHVAVLLYEKVRARLLRLRGRPDPGRVDLNKLMPVTFVVILLVGGLSVLTILADVVNPIANPFQ